MTKTWLSWMFVMVLMAAACGEATSAVEEDLVSATLQTDVADEGKADSTGNWRVRANAMTMWVDTVLQPEVLDGKPVWVMNGRVSKTLTGFRAYTQAGYQFQGDLTSDRKFQVVLSQGDVLDVVGGERVYFDFFAKRGATPMYHGTVSFAARFANWAGSSALYVYRAVNPVMIGDALRFRGRASTRSGFALDVVYTDDDANPTLFDDEPNNYHFDWSPQALHLAANPTEDPVWFRGSDSAGTPVEKTASLEFRLVQIGLGTKPAFEAWPPQRCLPATRECLSSLGTRDTESCGWASQVRPCLDVVDLPAAPDRQRFVTDLRAAMSEWYKAHEADVRALDGRTLESALRLVTIDGVRILDGAELAELGLDPAGYDVFSHVDTVFRGSDRIWYGTYDKGGILLHVEAVN